VSDALEALVSDPDAKALAGGQSLIPLLNFRLVQPSLLVDLGRVDSLRGVTEDGNRLVVGAMTPQADAETHPLLERHCPLIAEALGYVGHPQIRSRGTIGGSIAHADPASELPAVLLALDGSVNVAATTYERTIDATDFFQGPYTTALAEGELVTSVVFQAAHPRTGTALVEVARRHGDYAICGTAVRVDADTEGVITGGRIAVFGVSDRPILLSAATSSLVGSRGEETCVNEVANAASAEVPARTDINGSSEYRKQLTRIVVQRGLSQAIRRAQEGDNPLKTKEEHGTA
jgi:carbon-monoxide dehydrogenase medium subunit